MTIRAAAAAVITAVTVLSAACTGEPGESTLDRYLCNADDLGDGYQQLIAGDFSPRDLADLGPAADAHERDLVRAGMERGRFAFWKETLPRPPFEPPLNVLCQVLAFEDADAAAGWVAALEPDPSVIATSAIAWLPEDARGARELARPGGGRGSPPRAFEVTAGSGDATTRVYFEFRAFGPYVVLVAAGKQLDGDPGAGLLVVERVTGRMQTRLPD